MKYYVIMVEVEDLETIVMGKLYNSESEAELDFPGIRELYQGDYVEFTVFEVIK